MIFHMYVCALYIVNNFVSPIYTIDYGMFTIQYTQFFLQNVQNFVHLTHIFFKKCKQYYIQNYIHNFSKNKQCKVYLVYTILYIWGTQYCTFNVHKIFKHISEHSIYTIFQRMYKFLYMSKHNLYTISQIMLKIILYIQCTLFIGCTQFYIFNAHNSIYSTYTIFKRNVHNYVHSM